MYVTLSEWSNPKFYKLNFIGTFGGESRLTDDFELRDYGIQLGDLTLSDLSPEEIKDLAIIIINHLGVCGHRFELGFHQDGQYIKAI